MAGPTRFPIVRLAGVPLHAVTSRRSVAHVMSELDAGRGGWVVTPNLDYLRRLVRDRTFRELCRDADLAVADGMPLVWASRLQGTPLPERVAGSDLISSFASAAAHDGRSIFLLGGNPGAADDAARVLQQRNPGLTIAGTHCPPMGFESQPEQIEALTDALRQAQPDLIFVGLGSPKTELWINRLRTVAPDAWWIGVGISFSFLSGEVSRAPRWMQASGLEWCHRLAQEPRRLVRRYLVDGLPFAAQLMAGSARARLFGGAARSL